MKTFFGKYRGKVTNNVDPQQRGRLQVSVPAVLGAGLLSWAMPCVPLAGPGMGVYVLPPVGANIWVEFEGGDPEYPIWSGCFWGRGETPPLALGGSPASPNILLGTLGQNSLLISDLPGPAGGLRLQNNKSGAMISVNDAGITITDGNGATIVLAKGLSDINSGALTIK